MNNLVKKDKAVELRKLGYSYPLIAKKLNVSKSTLSYWLKNIQYTPNKIVQNRIKNSIKKSSEVLHIMKIKRDSKAHNFGVKEIGLISDRDLWMIGLGLYIGEGAKNKTQMVRFVNSDPIIIRTIINWFKLSCGLGLNNFKIAIHTYPDLDINKILSFWSKTTKIPISQFRKTQIDCRQNKSEKNVGKCRYGTAEVTVYSGGDGQKGVYLFHRIMGWIEAVKNQCGYS